MRTGNRRSRPAEGIQPAMTFHRYLNLIEEDLNMRLDAMRRNGFDPDTPANLWKQAGVKV